MEMALTLVTILTVVICNVVIVFTFKNSVKF